MTYEIGKAAAHALLVAATIMVSASIAMPAYAQVKIRVGSTVSTDISAAALSLAIKNGAFKKACLDVEVKTFVQSNQKYDTFKAGALDMDINMGAINAAQLFSAGVPVLVLRAATAADIWAVVARPDSALKLPTDLKGKRFGVVSLSGTNFGTTYAALKLHKVDMMRDMKVSTLPPSALMLALDKGEIDGATIYEPYLTPALKSGRVKVLFKPGELYQQHYKEPFLALVIAGHKDFVAKNRAAAAKFVAVMEETMTSLPANTDQAAQAMLEVMPDIKLSLAEIKELLLPYVPNMIKTPNTAQTVKTAQGLYDRMLEAKQIREGVKAADFWVQL